MRVQYSRAPRPMHPSGLRAMLPEDAEQEAAAELGSVYRDAGRSGSSGGPSGGPPLGAEHPLVWDNRGSSGRRALMVSPMWVASLRHANGTSIGDAEGQARGRRDRHTQTHPRTLLPRMLPRRLPSRTVHGRSVGAPPLFVRPFRRAVGARPPSSVRACRRLAQYLVQEWLSHGAESEYAHRWEVGDFVVWVRVASLASAPARRARRLHPRRSG